MVRPSLQQSFTQSCSHELYTAIPNTRIAWPFNGTVRNGCVTNPSHAIHYTPVTLVSTRVPHLWLMMLTFFSNAACPTSISDFSLLMGFVHEFLKFGNLGPDTARHEVCYIESQWSSALQNGWLITIIFQCSKPALLPSFVPASNALHMWTITQYPDQVHHKFYWPIDVSTDSDMPPRKDGPWLNTWYLNKKAQVPTIFQVCDHVV